MITSQRACPLYVTYLCIIITSLYSVLNLQHKSKIIKYEILLYENFFYDVPYTIHFRIYNVL